MFNYNSAVVYMVLCTTVTIVSTHAAIKYITSYTKYSLRVLDCIIYILHDCKKDSRVITLYSRVLQANVTYTTCLLSQYYGIITRMVVTLTLL